jgi:hypothetical protein
VTEATEPSAEREAALPSRSLTGAKDALYVVPEGTAQPPDIPAGIFAATANVTSTGQRR